MPPPMKNAITNQHEELLWNNKLLSTETSIGLIQAVIFYLIKCFGLWQGRDLKLLKTEHVTFGEDEIGKFVAIDLKKALGSGRVIKRYDDQGNPRSVYKIMKTYKGYLANEGPFLVRPISSIKDYICYSPWPVGLTILEQTVVNIMQDCGIGPGFGNVSVCLMSIDILKSFGTGGHCISTWFSRLYPKYKKTFWTEAFRECSDMNCEDKNQEACLMISHLLDPPYPEIKMLGEMKKHQEMMKHKVKAKDAQRSGMFTSWISNINSAESTEAADTTDTGSKKSKVNNTGKFTTKATGKDKPHSRIKDVKSKMKQNISRCDTSTKPSQQSAVPPSTSSLPGSSNITVRTEILTDCESSEINVNTSDMKIMAVLSIPESAFSAQVDEAECTADGIVEDHTPEDQSSERRGVEKTCTDNLSSTFTCFKRKLNNSEDDNIDSSLGAKQTKVYKQEIRESEAEKNGSLTDDNQMGKATDIESDCDIVSLDADIKEELDTEGESSIDMVSSNSNGNSDSSGNNQVYSANMESCSTEYPDTGNITRDRLQNCHGEFGMIVYPSSSESGKPDVDEDHFLSEGLDSELPAEHDLEVPSACISKTCQLMAESTLPSLSSPNSLSSISTKPSVLVSLSNKSKDSIKILRKLLQEEGKTDMVSGDLGSKESHGEISRHSSSQKVLWETTCADPCSSPVQEAEATEKEDSHTSQGDRTGNVYHNTNKSHVCNSHTSLNHLDFSAVSNSTLSVNEILNVSTTKNPACLSNNRTGTDIVRFLDAANQQLENILQLSSPTSQSRIMSPHSSKAGVHSDHLNEEQSSGLSSQPHKLMINDSSQNVFLRSKPRCENISTADSMPACMNLKHQLSFNTVSAASMSQTSQIQNMYASNKNAPSPLLRSVLEEPTSSGTEAEESPIQDPLKSRLLKTRSIFKKKPARLKVPLLKRAHRVHRCCCKCRNNPYYRPKTDLPLRKISHHKHTHKNDKLHSSHRLDEINSTDNCNTSTSSHPHSLDPSISPNPSSSLLTKATTDSSSNSGFYYYRSDHIENAAYQSVRINKGNKKSQTFTISDLPFDAPDSRHRGDCLGSPTSEMCLGDYFPAGTVLPVKDVKMLTRQSSNGLEVVFKFEYRVPKHDTETVDQLDGIS